MSKENIHVFTLTPSRSEQLLKLYKMPDALGELDSRWANLLEALGYTPDKDAECWGATYEETFLEDPTGRRAIHERPNRVAFEIFHPSKVDLNSLDSDAAEARKPLPPYDLIGAKHDKCHNETGNARPANTRRNKSKT